MTYVLGHKCRGPPNLKSGGPKVCNEGNNSNESVAENIGLESMHPGATFDHNITIGAMTVLKMEEYRYNLSVPFSSCHLWKIGNHVVICK